MQMFAAKAIQMADFSEACVWGKFCGISHTYLERNTKTSSLTVEETFANFQTTPGVFDLNNSEKSTSLNSKIAIPMAWLYV